MRFNVGQFLMDFFREDDTVEVNAMKLQSLIQDYKNLKKVLKAKETKIQLLEAKLAILEEQKAPYVELDVRA